MKTTLIEGAGSRGGGGSHRGSHAYNFPVLERQGGGRAEWAVYRIRPTDRGGVSSVFASPLRRQVVTCEDGSSWFPCGDASSPM